MRENEYSYEEDEYNSFGENDRQKDEDYYLEEERKSIEFHNEYMDKIIGILGGRIKGTKEGQATLENIIKTEFMNTPQLAKDVLNFIRQLSADNQKVHDKVIDTHRNTIDKLFERLDKDNLSEKEIDYIYDGIKDLSEKVEKARKSWKDWMDKIAYVLLGSFAVALGHYVKSKYDNQSTKARDIIDGEFTDIKSKRT
ncbi:hypothetical protein OB973_05400 [Bacillus cereus]|nr:hypothetical protein [Bacillus cereus]MCU4892945.1 hypothetical protein [Bacillus cereus]